MQQADHLFIALQQSEAKDYKSQVADSVREAPS